jgi:hypothetical protein
LNGDVDGVDYDADDGEIIASSVEHVDQIIEPTVSHTVSKENKNTNNHDEL